VHPQTFLAASESQVGRMLTLAGAPAPAPPGRLAAKVRP